MKTLMPHQIKALDYAKKRKKIALLLEMRLGKTLVAIRWEKYHNLKSILILAPKATHPSWRSELLEEKCRVFSFTDETLKDRYMWCELAVNKSDILPQYVLLNYEAVSLYPMFLELSWDGIIADESTFLRNPKARITKYLTNRTDHIRYKAILSGLPAPESPMDYFSQFKFLHGSFMNETNFWNWRNKNCWQIGYSWEVKKKRLPLIKQEVHELAFVLTRKEAGMGSKKIYERRYVDLSSSQKKLTKQIEKDFEYEYDEEEKEMCKHSPVKYIWLARVAGGFSPKGTFVADAKIKEIEALLQGELQEQRIVIWFRFNFELEYCYKRLSKNFKCGIFMAKRKEGVNLDGTLSKDIQIMLAQTQLGKMGLPWYDSSAMIFYSNHYAYEIRAQAEDRGIHPMKKEPYLIIDLIAKDSIDEIVVDLLLDKKTQAKYFMSKLEEAWQKQTQR